MVRANSNFDKGTFSNTCHIQQNRFANKTVNAYAKDNYIAERVFHYETPSAFFMSRM